MSVAKPFSLAMAAAPCKKARQTIPTVADLTKGKPTSIRPPAYVLQKFHENKLIMGVDVETAGWEEGDTKASMHKGRFGFLTRCREEVFNQRIVQIGWAIGDLDAQSAATGFKERTIKPEGFAITEKASKFHGITNETAQQGVSLREAMVEFMGDIQQAAQQGGRVVIHHLEFDAGLIANELVNAGLEDLMEAWVEIAKKGFCTMDPDVGKWLQACKGRDFQEFESNNVLSLRHMIDLLFPRGDDAHLLKPKLHRAGADAQAHRLVYNALHSLAKSASV